jgi:hypothetical protein
MSKQANFAMRGVWVLVLLTLTAPSWADRDHDRYLRHDAPAANYSNILQAQDQRRDRTTRDDRRSQPNVRVRRDDDRYRRNPVTRDRRGYVLDQRYRHDRYYPARGTRFRTLPREHREIRYLGTRYFFHGGVWYRHVGTRYIVIQPPIGLYISVLPPYYTTIWFGGIPYYYAAGVYYTWLPDRHVYVVASPPSDESISEPPGDSEQLFVYPKQGQSEQQQATDRYECYEWSKSQTGFDPTVQGGDVPAGEHDSKRADYNRAMKACLEARGYSVQ